MSALRHSLDDYLALRRALGFKLESAEPLLRSFVAFLDRRGVKILTVALALAWAKEPSNCDPYWWSSRLLVARGFAKYLQAVDARNEVPEPDLLPIRSRRAVPYLYSEDDVARLMKAAETIRFPLVAGTYRTLIGLLFTTGLRIGETIKLDEQDLDLEHRALIIRNSKFGKSREVCLHDSTFEALLAYGRLRDRLCLRRKVPSFFLSMVGRRLIYKNVQHVFGRLARRAGLERRSARCRPRIHDLRHTFAVRTLIDWYREGADVQVRLPQLSTYLGHVDPLSTYWYLSAAPELLALASCRLGRSLEEAP